MNDIFIGNILFYLSPYVMMLLHDKINRKVDLSWIYKLKEYWLIFIGLLVLLLTFNPPYLPRRIFFGFPDYLLVFYLGNITLLFICYIEKDKAIQAFSRAFLTVYTASFIWEIPINVVWIHMIGWHQADILHFLGAFPYLYLYQHNTVTKKKIFILTLIPILFTSLICLFHPIYKWQYIPWEPYFLIGTHLALLCRVVAFASLGYAFKPVFGK